MPIRSLTLVLTNRCNLACRYCYQEAERSRRMSEEVLRAALDELLATDEGNPLVTFTGGEPLLEYPLLRWAVKYLRRNARPDQQVGLSLLTNGTLMTPAVVDSLARHRVEVQLSCDGVAPAQDLRGPGTFRNLDGLLIMLQEHHPEFFRHYLTVTMTVLPATVQFLSDSFSYFLSRKVRRLTMTPVLTTSPGWWPERIVELDRQFQRICEQSLQHHDLTGDIPLLLFRPDATEQNAPPGSTEQNTPPELAVMCSVLDRSSLAVDVDGQLFGCAAFTGSTQSASSGLLHDFQQACRWGRLGVDAGLENRERQPTPDSMVQDLLSKKNKHSSYGQCADCAYSARCTVCPLAIGSWGDNQDPRRVPDFICAFNLTVMKYQQRFLERACTCRTRLNSDVLLDQMRPWLEQATTFDPDRSWHMD